MKYAVRMLIAVALFAAAFAVHAQSAPAQLQIAWTAPTTNTDGTPYVPSVAPGSNGYNVYIASSDALLSSYNYSLTHCPAAGPTVGCLISLGAGVLNAATVALPVGTYFVAVTKWDCPSASPCVESSQSLHVQATVTAAATTPTTPNPPLTVTVTTAPSAH